MADLLLFAVDTGSWNNGFSNIILETCYPFHIFVRKDISSLSKLVIQ